MAEFSDEQVWPPVDGLTKFHLRQYLAALKGRPKRSGESAPISDSCYESQYRRIKRFFNWFISEDYVKENPPLQHPTSEGAPAGYSHGLGR